MMWSLPIYLSVRTCTKLPDRVGETTLRLLFQEIGTLLVLFWNYRFWVFDLSSCTHAFSPENSYY